MPSIVRPFEADLGAATAIGNLFITDPIADSLVRGTLRVLGLEDVSFEARVDKRFQVTVRGVTISISFDPVLAFMGSAQKAESAAAAPTTIADLLSVVPGGKNMRR